jgi:DNA-binding FadR family transcriptional regulator
MTVTEQTTERLTQRVLSNEWPTGTVLPAERALAEAMQVSRPTVRAALGQLCAAGLLSARQGSGYSVLDWHQTGGFDLLPHLLSQPNHALAADFLELRRSLAAEAVALACVRASEHTLQALDTLAEAQRIETDPATFAARDLQFSQRVVRAANNVALSLLFNTVARTYAANPALAAAMHQARPAVAASYPAIVALLRAKDPTLARRAVHMTLEALDTATLNQMADTP